MNLIDAIACLDDAAPDPSKGLPEEVFEYVSRTTPLVNVDLLIQDGRGRTLLSWRCDSSCGQGWHVPGGIIRYKETMETRLFKVSQLEIGTLVAFDPKPIAINEIFLKHKIRGHFISFLYQCYLSGDFTPDNKALSPTDAGYLKWHDSCPEDLLDCHEIYRRYINRKDGM